MDGLEVIRVGKVQLPPLESTRPVNGERMGICLFFACGVDVRCSLSSNHRCSLVPSVVYSLSRLTHFALREAARAALHAAQLLFRIPCEQPVHATQSHFTLPCGQELQTAQLPFRFP